MPVDRNRARQLREAEHGAAYRVAPVPPRVCVYCGGDAKAGRDHVPPLAAASWFSPSALRWLYPACTICNGTLSVYPAACLVERAEFLVCILRRDWLRIKAGQSKRWPLDAVATKGRACKERLSAGDTAKACHCRSCAESKRP